MTYRVCRLPLIALLLVALVAAILLVAPRKAEADHVIWTATLTAKSYPANPYDWFGCFSWRTGDECSVSSNLSDNTFEIGGTTFTITALGYGTSNTQQPAFQLRVNKNVTTALRSLEVVVGSNKVLLSTCDYDAHDFPKRIYCYSPPFSWSVGASVSLRLENPAVTHLTEDEKADEEAERERLRELRKGASRSGVCGEDTTNSLQNDDADDTPGRWHCHGDIYHYHADWRKAHNAHRPVERVPLTPDPDPVPRPPATEPSSAADKAKGFGNWHTHSDGRFHRHAGGH